MKYKVLFVSLLSTLAVPYGTALDGDCRRDAGNKVSFHREATEEEIAKYEEETQRIANKEALDSKNLLDLAILNWRVGGIKTLDLDQKFQTFTEGTKIQAESLGESVNNLTTLLADTPGDDLTAQAANLIQESKKEKETEQALRREIEALKREQAESKALLDDVLKQRLSSIPQPSLPPETQPPVIISPSLTPAVPTGLSSYQQELLPRRHQIGDEAWKLLGGENPRLAAALSKGIQENQGMVEILFLGKQNFTLRINEEEQYYPYDF